MINDIYEKGYLRGRERMQILVPTLKKNYVLFIWNSNLALYPVFYVATIVRKGYIVASDDYMS